MSFESEVNFCMDFLKATNLKAPVIFSPASLLNSLAMIFVGANADTANVIAKIIGKNKNREEITDYYSVFTKKYNNIKKEDDKEHPPPPKPKKSKNEKFNSINVISANQLFVSDKSKLSDLFVKEMNEKFKGQFQQLDFTNTSLSVSVDEDGTEATAATSFGMMPRSAAPPKKFIANHPFIYFIVTLENKESKNINASDSKIDNDKNKKDTEENVEERVPKEILFAVYFVKFFFVS